MHILLIEEDAITTHYVEAGLTQAGYVVEPVVPDDSAVEFCKSTAFDVLLIARELSSLDTVRVICELRSFGVKSKIVVLNSNSSDSNWVDRSECGADDYLCKPFAMSELLARIESVGSDTLECKDGNCLVISDLRIDLMTKRAVRSGKEIDLLPREFLILEILMRNAGKVVSRSMLLEQVWDFYFDPKTRVVETHINRLKNKVDGPYRTSLLHNVRNIGYSIDVGT